MLNEVREMPAESMKYTVCSVLSRMTFKVSEC